MSTMVVLGLTAAAAAWAQGVPSPDVASAPDWLSRVVGQHGLWVGLVAVFFGGLALNLTPCVYPMIPVTMAFFTNQAQGKLARSARLAFLYVVGIASSYATLGVLAARTGQLLGSWLQAPGILLGIAAAVVALALGMFGLYDLRPPQALTRRMSRASAGSWGAFLMGLVVGIVAAPCIGPFVLGLFLLVSKRANPVEGFLLFFVLGLGMGLPYVVLGVLANRIGQLPKAGEWLVWSKHALGLVLLGLALYFIKPLLPARAWWWLLTGLLLAAGVYLGWLWHARAQGRRFVWVRRLIGTALVLSALAIVWPRAHPDTFVAWAPYSDTAFAHAQQEGRPILIDVYADWCVPCVELDHTTFRHPEVVRALSSVATLRVDATREVSDDAARLLERSQVFGAPTVMFFDHTGQEHEELRLLGFARPDELLERLKRIL